MEREISKSRQLLLYHNQQSTDTKACGGFTLVHAVSVDTHDNSMTDALLLGFVHYGQNYRRCTDIVVVCRLLEFHGFELAPLFYCIKCFGKFCWCEWF